MIEKLRTLTAGNKQRYLSLIFFFLVLLFAVSLFKNISYPLFWADESITVMHGKRVLEYGYPKVHDGRNVIYDLRHPNPVLGIDEKTDAFIGGSNWGQYYIAAIGVKLAKISEDIFTRTAIIRTFFALAGLTGLMLFALLGTHFFYSRTSKTAFLILFTFLELISVPLVLHLREVRYYPLTVLFVATTITIYARYRILNKTKYAVFLTFLTISLFLVFFTFSPAYFATVSALFLYESLTLAKGALFPPREVHKQNMHYPHPPKMLFRDYAEGILPLGLSLIAASPLISFFKMFYIAEKMAEFNTQTTGVNSLQMYMDNLSIMWRYFASSDFIYLAMALKIGLLLCFVLRILRKGLSPFDRPKAVFSIFLTLLFIVYFVAIAKIPNFPFTRYFIPLQPVLALIIILDAAVIFNFMSGRRPASSYGKAVLIVIFTGFVFYNISTSMEYIKGHVSELFHPYRGPLDYVIPFIKNQYTDTRRLVIATNYEETSFMYYLDCKVIVGFVGNNIEEDAQIIPDIVVYRKALGQKTWGTFSPVLLDFLGRAHYERASFPAVNYPTNNIPELNWAPPFVHRFVTEETSDERAKVDIYLKE